MSNTALRAEKAKEIIFISDAHEKFYYEKLKEVRYQDVYHKALVYCLGISDDTRRNIYSIYDFKTGCVKTECLHEGVDVGSCDRRKVSYEYESARGRTKRLKKKYAKDWNEVGEEERKRRAGEIRDLRAVYKKLPRYDARDTSFKKIQYTRYCDDFLIGVIGSKEDAETIKAEVKKFLAEELNLTLSDEKTKITHTSDCAEFLGYRIKSVKE